MDFFFSKVFYFFKTIFFFINKFSNFINFYPKKFSEKLIDRNYNYYFNTYNNYKNITKYNKIFKNLFFLDNFIFFLKKLKFEKKKQNSFRFNFRLLNTKNNFYFNFKNLLNTNKNYIFLKKYNLSGYYYMWSSLKIWFIPLFLCLIVIYMFIFLKSLPFNKIIFFWICVLMFSYWLLSGFVFFFKKYQFSKYTSSIQRFWRRTYIIFWLIEGSTFIVFLFFTINSSQESFYMLDQISVFKSHLYSWKLFFIKLFPIVILILFTYFLMLSLKWNVFSKHSIWLLVITLFLTYIVWLEFYQFFHVLNYYSNLNWVYDLDDHSWFLELESRKSRMVNHYTMILFILKFWHIIFIYSFWLFFVLRSLETKRIRYPLLSSNLQNFIILYIFSWVFMYPWFKFFFRKFLDSPYYWFYINNRKLLFRIFFYDFKLIYYGLLSYLDFNFLNYYNKYNFFYFKLSDSSNNYEFFKKNYIKNKIIKSIYNT